MLKIMDLPWVCQEKDTWWEASVPWMDSAYAVRVTDRGMVRLRVGYSSGFVPFDGTVEQAQQRAQEHFNEIIRGFVTIPAELPVWVAMADDHDYDAMSQWLIGVYLTEEAAIVAGKADEDHYVKSGGVRDRHNVSIEPTTIKGLTE